VWSVQQVLTNNSKTKADGPFNLQLWVVKYLGGTGTVTHLSVA